jgi:hypothetical protein
MGVTMVPTALRSFSQPAVKKGLYQFFNLRPGCASPHRNALLGEQFKRPPTNFTHDDRLDTLRSQPAGKDAMRVVRR